MKNMEHQAAEQRAEIAAEKEKLTAEIAAIHAQTVTERETAAVVKASLLKEIKVITAERDSLQAVVDALRATVAQVSQVAG